MVCIKTALYVCVQHFFNRSLDVVVAVLADDILHALLC